MARTCRSASLLRTDGTQCVPESSALLVNPLSHDVKRAHTAVDIDRVPEAYALAEHHNDFETLIWLCNHPDASEGPSRLQAYIEKFGEDFAFVLYQWYIDHGRPYSRIWWESLTCGTIARATRPRRGVRFASHKVLRTRVLS